MSWTETGLDTCHVNSLCQTCAWARRPTGRPGRKINERIDQRTYSEFKSFKYLRWPNKHLASIEGRLTGFIYYFVSQATCHVWMSFISKNCNGNLPGVKSAKRAGSDTGQKINGRGWGQITGLCIGLIYRLWGIKNTPKYFCA